MVSDNMLKDEKELKAIVEKDMKKFLEESAMEVEVNEKIFRHED